MLISQKIRKRWHSALHGAEEEDNDIYVMINASTNARHFGIHEGTPGEWETCRRYRTNQPPGYTGTGRSCCSFLAHV